MFWKHARASPALLLPLALLGVPAGALASPAGAGVGAGAASPAIATLNSPGPQSAIAGTAITAVPVTGSEMKRLKELKPLPPGLTLRDSAGAPESEWEIVGTPTTPGVSEVELQAENGAGEVSPTVEFTYTVAGIDKPATQHAIVGQSVNLIIKGAGLKTLKAAAASFPEGLELKDVGTSETEWEIVGKPALSGGYTVELQGENAKEEALLPVEFTLDVAGFHEPGPQFGTVGVEKAIFVLGAELVNVTASGLPAGLELIDHEGGVIEIAGTPTAAGEYEVEMNAEDEAKQPLPPVRFRVTIAPAPVPSPSAPTATGELAVSPAAAFSAARSSCGGVSFSTGTVATQWLLDGAPIAGATSATYTAPRIDDGHVLSCRQTATAANGTLTQVTSTGALVHEQPPQPVWPIGPASEHCAAALCMEDGSSAQTPPTRSYQQGGSWLAASQVRCVSAPWTSIAGNSTLAAVEGFAEAHTVTVTLQRITSGGATTLASEQLSGLGAAADGIDGSLAGSPFAGQIAAAYGTEAFAAGELWPRAEPGSLGKPDRFVAGQGYIAYQLATTPGVKRSFQLVYNLTAADLGARLRCVVAAEDGPGGAPTSATVTSPEYAVAKSSSCAPREIAHIGGPQPAVVPIGSRHCLSAQAGLAEIGGALPEVSSVAGRSVFALECALATACSGTLALATAGHRLASAAVSLRAGGRLAVSLRLDRQGRSRLRRAGSGGLPVTLTLSGHGASRLLLAARLANLT